MPKPTETGHYWFIWDDSAEVVFVYRDESDGRLRLQLQNNPNTYFVDELDDDDWWGDCVKLPWYMHHCVILY